MNFSIPYSVLRNVLVCSLSVCMAGCSSVAPVIKRTASARPSEFAVWTPELRSDEARNSYRFVMSASDNRITGLCLLKKNGEEWFGSLINEMGAKAFDFRITEEKCELLNVIAMMDKWYIKKTVAADLYFFIHADNPNASFHKRLERFEQNGIRIVNYKKKQVVVEPDGAVRLINRRHRLQYELRKMVELDPDKMIM